MSATFGVRLRRARHHLGMSLSDLERASGIPKSRLSRYENDHIVPSLASVAALARALGVEAAALVGEELTPWTAFVLALRNGGFELADVQAAEDAAAEILRSRAGRAHVGGEERYNQA